MDTYVHICKQYTPAYRIPKLRLVFFITPIQYEYISFVIELSYTNASLFISY